MKRILIVSFCLIFILISLTGSQASVLFDKTDDLCSNATLLDVNVPSDISISLWFKLTNSYTAGAGYSLYLFGKENIFNEDRLYLFFASSDGKLRGYGEYNNEGAWDAKSNSTSWSNNVWYFVVLTYNSSTNTWTLYISASAQTDTGSATGIMNDGTWGNFILGASSYSSVPFDGEITDFTIHNRLLTTTEIQLMFNGFLKGTGRQFSGCMVYVPMTDIKGGDSCDGQTLLDLVGGYNFSCIDGANNTGCTSQPEGKLVCPGSPL